MPQAQTIYSDITTIVVMAPLQQQAEAAAIAAEPDGGAGTFVPGTALCRPSSPSVVVAYWCRWNMKQGQRAAFAQNMGGPINVIAPGASVPSNRDRWLFDSSGDDGWTGEQVLAALNLTPYSPPD